MSEGAAAGSDSPEDARRLAVPSGARVEGTRDESCCRPLRATRSRTRASWRVSTCSWSASTRSPPPSRRPRRRSRRRTARSRAFAVTSRRATRRCRRSSARAQAAQPTAAGGPAADANELRSLRNAVAALTKERAEDRGAAQVEHSPRACDRSDSVSTSSPRAPRRRQPLPPRIPRRTSRVDALEAQLASVRSFLERRASEPDRPSDELRRDARDAALAGRGARRADCGRRPRSSSTTASPRWTARASSCRSGSTRSTESVESATTSLGSKEQRARRTPPPLHGVEHANRVDRGRHPRGAPRVSGAELDLARRPRCAARADRGRDARGDG